MPSAEIARLATPLGAVVLRVEDDGGAPLRGAIIEADAVEKDPVLPDGMRVSHATAIELRILVQAAPVTPVLSFELDSTSDGSPETGQWLDAVGFEDPGRVLSLATRDAEWMLSYGMDAGRLPLRLKAVPGRADPSAWSVSFTPRGLSVRPGILLPGERALCPFAFAYLSAGSDAPPVGPWFAVDAILP